MIGYRHPAGRAMDLARQGWKVRQIAGRRCWYKGKAGAEIVAKNMDDAERLEMTMRRTKAPSLFMFGPDIAEAMGAHFAPPTPRAPTAVEGWGFTDPQGQLFLTVCDNPESAETCMCFAANQRSTDQRRSGLCVSSPEDNKAAAAEGWRVVPVRLTKRKVQA